jgi:hypothetical protein
MARAAGALAPEFPPASSGYVAGLFRLSSQDCDPTDWSEPPASSRYWPGIPSGAEFFQKHFRHDDANGMRYFK